ncbi:hypothetical protein G6K96_20945, partial [Agrobacterium vitis]|nr:hypothetical protein [Agrobacterium vitis]NTA34201.1 hypothetical protein [Agrobacterium vitis]
MKYSFVAQHQKLFSVRTMCRFLRIHPSGFYAWFRTHLSKRADLAPKFYPVLSSLQWFLTCTPILGQRELEFSGVKAQVGVGADEPFMIEI